MTIDKHQKRKIRELAERMGCSYSTARQAFLGGDTALSDFQASATGSDLPALSSAGQRLLSAPLADDRQPTEENRVLEVTLLWGDTLIDVRCFSPNEAVRVGPTAPADLRIYDAAIPETFALFAEGNVCAPAGSQLSVAREGHLLEPTEGAWPLGLEDRALVSLSTTHLVLRWVKPTRSLEARRLEALDFYFTRVLSTTFLLHLLLLAGFWIAPIGEEQLGEELFNSPSPLTKAFLIQPRPKPIPVRSALLQQPTREQHAAQRPASTVRSHGNPGGRSRVMHAGLLEGVNLATLLAGPDKVAAALGQLTKNARVSDSGIGGFGTRGIGPGGDRGGPLDIGGSLGTDRVGRGPSGTLGFGNGHKPNLVIDRQPSRVVGNALSKEVIASIVRKHENEIRYCYESALGRQPDLSGKVSVAFTIGGTGEVSEADVGESTLGSATVEGCITTKVRRWKFPEPRGGGQVFVTYPWIFKPAGAD